MIAAFVLAVSEEREELIPDVGTPFERMAHLIARVEGDGAAGEFAAGDSHAACVRILVAVDGVGAYVNNVGSFDEDAYTRFVTDVAEWSLGIPAGKLRAAVDQLRQG